MKNSNFKKNLKAISMWFALFAIWVIFSKLTSGAFLQPRNLSNLFRQMSVTGILASGMVFILVLRQVDLSVGSMAAFLGACLAVFHTQKEWGAGASLAATLGIGLVLGSIQGFLTSYQRIPAFIVTLGGMLIFRGGAMWMTQNMTISLPDDWLLAFGNSYLSKTQGWILTGIAIATVVGISFRAGKDRKIFRDIGVLCGISGFAFVFQSYEGIPLPVFLMLVLMTLLTLVADGTVIGRQWYAMGGNPEAAFLSGVPSKRNLMFGFSLVGFLAALSALVLSARVGSASPDAGQLLELDAIAACVIGGTSLRGGKGTVFGALLGALVMESLNNGMSLANIEPFWQFIIKGSVLVAAVWVDMLSQAGERTSGH
jgi:D-xylose transport system permease protein